MSKRALQIGRPTRGHHFQADRYSFRERQVRRGRNPLFKLARWWADASFMERACRALWLAVCGSVGLAAGVIAVVLILGPVSGLR